MSTNKSFSTETSERYSRALFEVAQEASELEKIENDIKNFASLLINSLEIKNFIHNPTQSKDNQNNVIEELTEDEALKLIADEIIAGGMIPKINTCIDAVEKGVSAAVIVDGRVKHAVLLELFTEHGAGTLIR